jgi:biotin synthase
MCYAIPGKVEAIDEKTVTVNYFGERKKAINELRELAIGDYIYAQGGFVIEKIPADQAEDILQTWKEVFFELQDLDLRLSRLQLDELGVDKKLGQILDRALEEKPLKKAEWLYLLGLQAPPELELLYKAANFLRQKYHKNACCVHGIIEISNYCRRQCAYCGIAGTVTGLERYRMTRAEIVTTALEAVEKYGFRALVLQSGEDPGYTADELAEVIAEIKAKAAVLIFISFGDLPPADLEKLYKAGARGVLLRFETSNAGLYGDLHKGHDLAGRLETLRVAQRLGYLLVTGGLVGLPGQTREDILADLDLTKKLEATMFSFGPFIPHPRTPLARASAPEEAEILKVLALARLIDPQKANVVVTTGFETLSPTGRKKGLMAGANSVMLNLTPLKYRRLYSIYPNRAHQEEDIAEQIKETVSLLQSIGRAPTDLGVF